MTLGELLYQLTVSLGGTLAFAVLFFVPPRQYLACGVTGAAGWLVYTLTLAAQPSPVIASLVAVLPLTALARLFSTRRKAPITLFLLCGIFPLVPGAGIYYTAYYFITGDSISAGLKGAETIKVAGALALGMVLVLSLPNRLFQPWRRQSEAPSGSLSKTSKEESQ